MKISAIIPAFNSERTVARALESILAQTRPADEIIVIDDGSTDQTADIVRAFGNKVTLIRQANAGVSVARNAGIRAASGDWIAFLDADDQWLPEKLQLQSAHLGRHGDLAWTFSNFYEKKPDSSQRVPGHPSMQVKPILKDETFEDYFIAYRHHAYAWTGTLMVRRDVFDVVGGFEPGMKRAQDNDLWYRIAYAFPKVGYLFQPLAVYHLDTPVSSTKINDTIDFMLTLVRRHEALSGKYNRNEAFAPCITHMLEVWLFGMLRQNRFSEAKQLIEQFPDYLQRRFQREMRFRLLWPPLTNTLADGLRLFKNRRRA